MGFLTSAFVGSVFGTSFDLSLMNDPAVIRTQFAFSSFWMLRMFLSASSTSVFSIYVLNVLGKREQRDIDFNILRCLSLIKKNIIGGILLGCGMVLSGSCPGTVWSQMGSNRDLSALFVVIGCLQGCFFFAKIQDASKKTQNQAETSREDKKPRKMNHVLPLGLISVFFTVIVLVEQFFPWSEQSSYFVVNYNVVAKEMVDPALSGIAIGLSQIVSYIGNDCGLGSSAGWMYITGHLAKLFGLKSKTLEQSSKSEGGKKQASAAIFIALGSFLVQTYFQTSLIRRSRMIEPNAADLLQSFLGGFCIIFGARIAGGCTSGHGLTGIANINPLSFVTVAGMFLGGCSLVLVM